MKRKTRSFITRTTRSSGVPSPSSFSFIAANRINGVFLLSADRHRSDAYRIEREAGYDLYEASSSRLTNVHSHRRIESALFHFAPNAFGMLTFDTLKPDPELSYQIVGLENEVAWTLELKLSDLSMEKR